MRALGPVTSSAALASPAAAMSGVVCRTAGDAPARLSPAISTLRATETTTLVALVRPAFALPVPDLRSELRVDFDPDGRKSRVRRNTFRLLTKKGRQMAPLLVSVPCPYGLNSISLTFAPTWAKLIAMRLAIRSMPVTVIHPDAVLVPLPATSCHVFVP